ncbi:hypothetical protein [Bradyrhizobium valentinum]|uniref:hypothetical protein n=1 Tax=Bradyrhizobium valentinum TaxID=1518501 RepID=UPI00070D6D42|nr:hypothetical protein [Bradyrhizobium valentinum]KRR11013.1 hypothetical protein CQ10_40470 [Bradyrhizobium valentinum]
MRIIYSEPVFAMAREYSILKLCPIGEIMTAERHGPDAQRDVARRVLEQKLEGLHARPAAVEDLLFRVSCGLAGVLPPALCGKGAP